MISHQNSYLLRLVYHKVLSLVHFFFLIYINGLSDGLVSTVKPFADDTFLFLNVHGSNRSAN